MKKMILTVVAMMSLTFGFAETENQNVVNNVERYDMSFDMRRLASKLDLTSEQMDAVEAIQECFNNDMSEAGEANRHHRRMMMVHQAVRKNVHQMHRVLNNKQFDTYMLLLGTTLHNKGL